MRQLWLRRYSDLHPLVNKTNIKHLVKLICLISLKFQILCLLEVKSSLTFTQLQCEDLLTTYKRNDANK